MGIPFLKRERDEAGFLPFKIVRRGIFFFRGNGISLPGFLNGQRCISPSHSVHPRLWHASIPRSMVSLWLPHWDATQKVTNVTWALGATSCVLLTFYRTLVFSTCCLFFSAFLSDSVNPHQNSYHASSSIDDPIVCSEAKGCHSLHLLGL